MQRIINDGQIKRKIYQIKKIFIKNQQTCQVSFKRKVLMNFEKKEEVAVPFFK